MSGRRTEWIAIWYETHRPAAASVARYGLGVTILLAGIHKLIAPTAWTIYLIGGVEPFILVTPLQFMLLNGILEIAFGLAIVGNHWTVPAVAIVAISLAATTVYLALVAVVRTGQFVDILIRDLGLLALAVTVLVQQLGNERGKGGA